MVNPNPKVPNAPKCGDFGGRNKAGEPCGKPVVGGTRRCDMHAGKKRAVAKAEGAVVVELRKWGLVRDEELADPGETLLRLVTQSAARCEMYAQLLGEAYDAAERLRLAEDAPDGAGDLVLTARMDFERVMNHGGVAALIGHRYAGTQTSGVIATGEAIRGLVELERDERDRCANFAAKAVAAGLAERQVRLAERMGGQLLTALSAVASALGANLADPAVAELIQRQVAAALGVSLPQLTIEGQVA